MASRGYDPSVNSLYTIGHSSHSWDQFLALLEERSVDFVCDVRSSPYSRRFPQFDGRTMRPSLEKAGLKYLYLGDMLGGRGKTSSDYEGGRVSYTRLAARKDFAAGLDRVRNGVAKYNVALMCAEKDPANCHRAILVCRHLRSESFAIRHILSDGSLDGHKELELRLLRLNGLPDRDMFDSTETLIERAYSLQEAKIAFALPAPRGEHDEAVEEEGGE